MNKSEKNQIAGRKIPIYAVGRPIKDTMVWIYYKHEGAALVSFKEMCVNHKEDIFFRRLLCWPSIAVFLLSHKDQEYPNMNSN